MGYLIAIFSSYKFTVAHSQKLNHDLDEKSPTMTCFIFSSYGKEDKEMQLNTSNAVHPFKSGP